MSTNKPNAGFWSMSTYFFGGIGLRDTDKDDAWHVDWPNFALNDQLWRCESHKSWQGEIVFQIHKGKHCTMPFPDMPLSQPVPICSDRARELFEKLAPDGIQYLPITLEHKGKPIGNGQYWIMNLLRLVDCVDESQSDWRFHSYTKSKMYRTWIIDPSRVPQDAAIFRIKGEDASVVVTEKARCLVEQARITGVGFTELGDLFVRAPDWKPGPLELPPS